MGIRDLGDGSLHDSTRGNYLMAEEVDRPKDPFPRDDHNRLIEPDYIRKERDNILTRLRDAKPRFIDNPGAIPKVTIVPASPLLDQPRGSITKNIPSDPFGTTFQEVSSSSQGTNLQVAFALSNASSSTGDPPVTTYKAKIFDGKVNGQYPTGMGFNNYVLTVPNPNDCLIYVGITFNPTTLAITSVFAATSTAAAYPESRVETPSSGFLYYLIGFTFLDVHNAFHVVNARLGNINFVLIYGSQNGNPALLPVDSEPGWLDLDLL